eukprot:3937965-Rhodomonas_salina.1
MVHGPGVGWWCFRLGVAEGSWCFPERASGVHVSIIHKRCSATSSGSDLAACRLSLRSQHELDGTVAAKHPRVLGVQDPGDAADAG